MSKYRLFAGMHDPFGGIQCYGITECNTKDTAEEMARDIAIEIYQRYEGLYGIRSETDIREDYMAMEFINSEHDLESEDEEYIWESYMEEVERWIEYYVEEVKE